MRVAAGLIAAFVMTLAVARAEIGVEYVDPGRRFRFSYPAEFGAPSPGTNDGFQDRVAAIRFAVFSSGIGGEAALTRGFPVVDIQAAGGLYDAITLEIFPESMRRLIVQALTPLSATNFCQQIAQEQHLDPQAVALAGLTAQQKLVIASTDRMRNVSAAGAPLCRGRHHGDVRQGSRLTTRRPASARVRRDPLSREPLCDVSNRSRRVCARFGCPQPDGRARQVLEPPLRRAVAVFTCRVEKAFRYS